VLTAWIDIGAPSAERIHKAAKLAERVVIYTHAALPILEKEAALGNIHRAAHIDVMMLEAKLLAELETKIERNVEFELVRTDGQLYVTIAGAVLEGKIETGKLSAS
jgi:uncharacterized protein YaeQ